MNLIATLPALAVSDVLVNFSAPPGSAATESELALAEGAAVVVVRVVVGGEREPERLLEVLAFG